MERSGRIKSWNEAKGFGFIQPEQGEPVFVHLSALHGERRPAVGDSVLFVAGRDAQGRVRAEHVRPAGEWQLDEPSIRQRPARQPAKPARASASVRPRRAREPGGVSIRQPGLKALLFLGLCALPVGGALLLWLKGGSPLPLAAYGLVSLIAFFLYWEDKRKAQSDSWRTPENVLHAAELAGGWPGALLAQQVFRHKTRKLSYQVTFWTIVALHQAFWGDRLLLGGRYLGRILGPVMGF